MRMLWCLVVLATGCGDKGGEDDDEETLDTPGEVISLPDEVAQHYVDDFAVGSTGAWGTYATCNDDTWSFEVSPNGPTSAVFVINWDVESGAILGSSSLSETDDVWLGEADGGRFGGCEDTPTLLGFVVVDTAGVPTAPVWSARHGDGDETVIYGVGSVSVGDSIDLLISTDGSNDGVEVRAINPWTSRAIGPLSLTEQEEGEWSLSADLRDFGASEPDAVWFGVWATSGGATVGVEGI